MATAPLAMATNGNILALIVTAISNMAAPTVAEVTAGTVIDASCYFTELNLSLNENTVEDVRLCTKQVFEVPGDYTESVEVTYTYNPPSATNDKARLALVEGSVKYLVVRYGIDPDTTIIAGDFVDVYKFRSGKQRKNTPARNSVHTMTQKLFLSAVTKNDVTIAA